MMLTDNEIIFCDRKSNDDNIVYVAAALDETTISYHQWWFCPKKPKISSLRAVHFRATSLWSLWSRRIRYVSIPYFLPFLQFSFVLLIPVNNHLSRYDIPPSKSSHKSSACHLFLLIPFHYLLPLVNLFYSSSNHISELFKYCNPVLVVAHVSDEYIYNASTKALTKSLS